MAMEQKYLGPVLNKTAMVKAGAANSKRGQEDSSAFRHGMSSAFRMISGDSTPSESTISVESAMHPNAVAAAHRAAESARARRGRVRRPPPPRPKKEEQPIDTPVDWGLDTESRPDPQPVPLDKQELKKRNSQHRPSQLQHRDWNADGEMLQGIAAEVAAAGRERRSGDGGGQEGGGSAEAGGEGGDKDKGRQPPRVMLNHLSIDRPGSPSQGEAAEQAEGAAAVGDDGQSAAAVLPDIVGSPAHSPGAPLGPGSGLNFANMSKAEVALTKWIESCSKSPGSPVALSPEAAASLVSPAGAKGSGVIRRGSKKAPSGPAASQSEEIWRRREERALRMLQNARERVRLLEQRVQHGLQSAEEARRLLELQRREYDAKIDDYKHVLELLKMQMVKGATESTAEASLFDFQKEKDDAILQACEALKQKLESQHMQEVRDLKVQIKTLQHKCRALEQGPREVLPRGMVPEEEVTKLKGTLQEMESTFDRRLHQELVERDEQIAHLTERSEQQRVQLEGALKMLHGGSNLREVVQNQQGILDSLRKELGQLRDELDAEQARSASLTDEITNRKHREAELRLREASLAKEVHQLRSKAEEDIVSLHDAPTPELRPSPSISPERETELTMALEKARADKADLMNTVVTVLHTLDHKLLTVLPGKYTTCAAEMGRKGDKPDVKEVQRRLRHICAGAATLTDFLRSDPSMSADSMLRSSDMSMGLGAERNIISQLRRHMRNRVWDRMENWVNRWEERWARRRAQIVADQRYALERAICANPSSQPEVEAWTAQTAVPARWRAHHDAVSLVVARKAAAREGDRKFDPTRSAPSPRAGDIRLSTTPRQHRSPLRGEQLGSPRLVEPPRPAADRVPSLDFTAARGQPDQRAASRTPEQQRPPPRDSPKQAAPPPQQLPQQQGRSPAPRAKDPGPGIGTPRTPKDTVSLFSSGVLPPLTWDQLCLLKSSSDMDSVLPRASSVELLRSDGARKTVRRSSGAIAALLRSAA